MERSVSEVVVYVALAMLGLALVATLGFAAMFGAADHQAVTFEARPFSPDDVVADLTYDPTDRTRSVVDHTVQNGSSRTVALRYEPFFEDAPSHQVRGDPGAESVYVEHAGTFYRVAVSNVSEVETQRQTLELVGMNETPGPVIEFDDLPAVDRRAVRTAHAYKYQRDCGDAARSERPPPCWSTYSTGDANQSVLVPSPQADYVAYRNETFQLDVRERTVAATAIIYRATPVANDTAEFRSQFVTEVDDAELTDGEREMLDQAIDEGYHIRVQRHDLEQVPRERFNRILPKLGLPTLDELSRGHHGSSVGYIDYRGGYYRIHIEYSDTYA